MRRFQAELKLADVGYRELLVTADHLDKAERLVAGCDGMSNRRLFHNVDSAWAELRDGELRQALRELRNTLLSIADAVHVARLDDRGEWAD